jgi:hypothetical protein
MAGAADGSAGSFPAAAGSDVDPPQAAANDSAHTNSAVHPQASHAGAQLPPVFSPGGPMAFARLSPFMTVCPAEAPFAQIRLRIDASTDDEPGQGTVLAGRSWIGSRAEWAAGEPRCVDPADGGQAIGIGSGR